MKQYLVALLGVCAVAAVVRGVAFESSVKKYLEMLCAVCVIGAVTVPMVTVVAELGGVGELFSPEDTAQELDYDEIYNQYLVEGNLRASEQLLSEELCKRFERENGSIDVGLSADIGGAGITLTGVVITLKNGAVSVDPQELGDYLRERLGLECEIVYELFPSGRSEREEGIFVEAREGEESSVGKYKKG